MEDALRRIGAAEGSNIFISVASDAAAGSPVVAVKDLIHVRGFPTTGGGRIFPDRPSDDDAAVVANIRAGGACIVGKTNLDEFGCGVTGENEHFGNVSHPADPSRVAGGSSGGSAAAVALGLCDWAIGTDTGGSIRIPAGLCGVTGMKPTTGLVPTSGTIPLSPSLDAVGPIATDVRTVASALEAMTGKVFALDDRNDGRDFALAVPRDWIDELDEPTSKVWKAVADGLPDVRLPSLDELRPPYEAILFAEGVAVHRESFAAVPERYGRRAHDFMTRGLAVKAVDYIQAIERREADAAAVEAAMGDHDALLVPTTPCVAPRAGEDPGIAAKLLRFTWPFNFTMNPVISLPGPRLSRLPVGLQVVGRRGDDRLVLAIAQTLERAWGRSHD